MYLAEEKRYIPWNGFMFAIQDEVIPTHSYLKYVIRDLPVVTDACGLYGCSLEAVKLLAVLYPKVAHITYKHLHDQVSKVFRQELAKQFQLRE